MTKNNVKEESHTQLSCAVVTVNKLTNTKMNSKYREVPRYNNVHGDRHANHVHNYHGVSSGARALREAENARLEALATQKGPSSGALFAVGALYVAVIFDATAWATTGWGYAENDNFYTRVGLWQICNGSLEPVPEGEQNVIGTLKVENSRSVPVQRCVFPTSVPQDWIHKALVMEIMGGFCAFALFVCLTMFVGSLKFTCVQSRTMTITLIPLAFLAALMNFIGALTISLNLSSIYCRPSYSVALDFLGVVFFAIGGICALLDIQGCFDKEEEVPAAPPQPLVSHPGVVFSNS